MNKSLLCLFCIACYLAPTAQAGVLGGAKKPTKQPSQQQMPDQTSSQQSSTVTPKVDQAASESLEAYGISPAETQKFLEKTKDMSPAELQRYF